MRKLALGLLAGAIVAVTLGVLSAGAVTTKPVVAVNVDEFSVFPLVQGRRRARSSSW